jgi:hypothetical protein
MGAPLLDFETIYDRDYQSSVCVPLGIPEITDIVTLDMPA